MACRRKVDGLRILQYLRQTKTVPVEEDSAILAGFLEDELGKYLTAAPEINLNHLDLNKSGISTLDRIRNVLFEAESIMRKERDDRLMR